MKKILIILTFIGFFTHFHAQPSNKNNLAELQKMAKEQPANPVYLFELANDYSRRKNYPDALPLYQKCMELNPDNCRYYLAAAKCHEKMDRPDLGRNVLTNALRYFNQNSIVYSELADLEYKLGFYPAAISNYQKAIQMADGHKGLAFLYSGLGKSFRETKDYEQARLYFLKSLSIKQDCWVYYEFGKLYYETGDYERAVWAFQKARSQSYKYEKAVQKLLSEKLASAYFTGAMKWKEAGKKDLAKKMFIVLLADKGLQNTASAEKAAFWLKRL